MSWRDEKRDRNVISVRKWYYFLKIQDILSAEADRKNCYLTRRKNHPKDCELMVRVTNIDVAKLSFFDSSFLWIWIHSCLSSHSLISWWQYFPFIPSGHLHWYEPGLFSQIDPKPQSSSPSLHSSISTHFLYLFILNPALHSHWPPPGVSRQYEFSPQDGRFWPRRAKQDQS